MDLWKKNRTLVTHICIIGWERVKSYLHCLVTVMCSVSVFPKTVHKNNNFSVSLTAYLMVCLRVCTSCCTHNATQCHSWSLCAGHRTSHCGEQLCVCKESEGDWDWEWVGGSLHPVCSLWPGELMAQEGECLLSVLVGVTVHLLCLS